MNSPKFLRNIVLYLFIKIAQSKYQTIFMTESPDKKNPSRCREGLELTSFLEILDSNILFRVSLMPLIL
jgi:hypothetical protein